MLHNINFADFFLQAANTPLALSAQEGWIIDKIFDILIEFKIFPFHHTVLAELGYSGKNSRIAYQRTHSGHQNNHINTWDFTHLSFENGNDVWGLFGNGQVALSRVPSLASNLPLTTSELGFVWVSFCFIGFRISKTYRKSISS